MLFLFLSSFHLKIFGHLEEEVEPTRPRSLVNPVHFTYAGTSGQSYKHFTLVNYDSRVIIWGIFQSGTTLES